MTIEALGYNSKLENYRKEQKLDSFKVGRVILEHKDRYIVKTELNEFDCMLTGNLRFSVDNISELPFVGDWVAISEYDEQKALIHNVFPRSSIIERKAVRRKGETQIIATNIDVGLIIQSVNRDFNINRLERYLTICNTSKIEPIIILSKIDLIEEVKLEEILTQVKKRIKNVLVLALSSESKRGIDKLKSKLISGKTYCLLGSSGVGKSTLINTVVGEKVMKTGVISKSIDRGMHVTTHRELIVFPKGILIDNPGMREVGITDTADGFETTFKSIFSIAQGCKYNDCTHSNEDECAVLVALDKGVLDSDLYENFLKMEKERLYFESNVQERKKKSKKLGKLIKNMKKNKYKY
ncbi:Small ribosomal subunit biogenesis GTPase RsgA [Tenacibaculum sp. 190524A02b]|uniref:Small ribosomal subunit biogenesis GTPase RsgA n=1 Tax=Tenacibaculum vairaonense TaxID=3137860 RepID=A0ABP1FG51_9FLAO